MPKPNAKPVYASGSMPTAVNTFGSTMPAPPSSIQPVRRAHRAARAAAEHARHRELDRRLGEREERRQEPGLDVGAEQRVDERLDRAEQVAERDALVDREPFDLVEHGRVPGVERVAAERAAGRDDVDRRPLRLHHAHLHRRRVRAQQHLLRLAEPHVERVLHRARRVPGREVERLRSCTSRARPRDLRRPCSRGRRRRLRARARSA